MDFYPKTICTKCHRRYAALRRSCPYCGTKREGKVRIAEREESPFLARENAPAGAKKTRDLQSVLKGAALAAVILAAVILVSVTLNRDAAVRQSEEAEQMQITVGAEIPTPVPTATPEPSPTPTPTPSVTSVQITWMGADEASFAEPVGTQVDLDVIIFPINDNIAVDWSSSDESVCTVDENGLVTVVGVGYCEIYANAGGITDVCQVWGS